MGLIPNGCIAEVLETKNKYLVHYLNVSKTYEFKLIQEPKSYLLHNGANNKIKTPEQVSELLKYNVIKVISIPSYYFEVWNK